MVRCGLVSLFSIRKVTILIQALNDYKHILFDTPTFRWYLTSIKMKMLNKVPNFHFVENYSTVRHNFVCENIETFKRIPLSNFDS